MREQILKILEDIEPDNDFTCSNDFFEDELMDSFGVMTLISQLEAEFGISICPEDISAEKFKNLDCIELLLQGYVREV